MTFKPIDASNEQRFGETAILLCGFAAQELKPIRDLLDALGIVDVKIIPCTEGMLAQTVGEALSDPAQGLPAPPEKLPRVMILSGLTNELLHALLNNYSATKLPRPIFAAATPESVKMPLKQLLVELLAEHKMMQNRKG